MINTITLNPSLDYIVKVDSFKVDALNRSLEEQVYAGGKGINVSIVLKNLGVENTALGYIAGFTGEEISRQVKEHGVNCDFIKLKNGLSRINVKLKSDGETEINGSGPVITETDLQNLYEKLNSLTKGDYLILSGSIPNSVPDDIYENIMKSLLDKGIEFVVDATKDLLLKVLKYKPFLIKPNHHELAEMFNIELKSDEDIITYGKKLQEMGAKNVLISMAGDGAILLPENGEPIKREVPKGVLKNSVGAGDSMVAGFLCGYLKNKNIDEAFKMGIATGSASAFSEELATKEQVEELLLQMK
ncbi:1-phosphofructokinase [Clostridium saccharobutylicum]|uniref:Tagatose-6-phosphate kinase n=1 Tax=Clostridium saccharobutylicum DSM 13864 TaxID=1345695 RepID=U5MUR4_CLOSA|nr:1-phosphofructokinase [Clostridium saccharobutylicum]AGX43192.1 1-phosphofructokinase FruK [Clostridium saccharobutylicum DSM 13864]AQR90491.1 tagatose-6-phosphate kinase [Clostridium saccharobutylicum]AQS00397.1 tagatose-6-phosphate kinase [Clostridium saccharobutylicum]AQS14380.1 tagatose-6-phosphate kinase [Clostridium saccharobutylicum]MBA2906665.1 1-phosphofructokinase [Clostridium saccharobutylicum]